MRIAMFVDGFPSISETFVLRQITGLIDLGHQVDIFAQMRPGDDVPIHPEIARYDLLSRTTYMDMPAETGYWELPVYPITGQTWVPGASKPIPNVLRLLRAAPELIRGFRYAPKLAMTVIRPSSYGYQARSLSSLYRLSALCSRPGDYDVIHAHFGPVGNNVRFVRDLWKAPLIVTFHGYDFSMWPREHGSGIYDSLFELVDTVTVNSTYAGKKVERLGCSPAKIYRLPVGLDLNCFPYRERHLPKPGEPVRLLTVGRLTEKKGIEYSIRAVDEARREYPHLRYDIIGEGPLRSELQALIQRLGLEEVVILHGAKPGGYVRQMMDEADIFLLTSVTASNGDQEGTPVALMEAQSSGLPTLSTWHGGISEIVVEGKTGFLVPERDVEAASERLICLVQNSDRWREMGMQGRRHAESNYDIHSLNRELADLYEKVVTQYKSGHRGAWA